VPTYAFSGSLTRPMPQYGAANGRGITCFAYDDATGHLSPLGETRSIDDTGWLVLDPRRKVLYATCERSGANQSAVAAYGVDPGSGGLTLLSTQPTLGGEACHASLSIDGRFLLVANYNGATPEGWPEDSIAVLPIDADGSLGPVVSSIRHRGHGPNASRQTTAHAHCVVPSPDGRRVYVADLGIDRIVCYALGADGSLMHEAGNDFAVPPGLGPRHLVFHPDGRSLFMVSELIPTVISFSVDPQTGALTERHSFPIPRLGDTIVQPAGSVLAANGRDIFVALRVCNEILGLAVGRDGHLTQTSRWPSGGATPRDLTLSPSGRHLLVGNQDTDSIAVFEVDQYGALSAPKQQQPVGTPLSIKIAAF
jgi:6-phosphogluconolactonase